MEPHCFDILVRLYSKKTHVLEWKVKRMWYKIKIIINDTFKGCWLLKVY